MKGMGGHQSYLSVCSGIEAATQAWHPLGWTPVAFSEIEPFPSSVLAHHYPNVPNWGDMTKFQEWPDANVDVLVGGTPCQSFSVAGLRKGLDDPRGNLALTYLAIAERYRPEWLVWENVPGVLSADGGRAFGAIVGGMVELGYRPAWRVLDAQYVRTRGFPGAVPQRRRRVFVVAHLGDWRRAAAVLFDAESLRGNPPPGREAGQAFATSLTERTRADSRQVELGGDVAYALDNPGDGGRSQTRLVAHETAKGVDFQNCVCPGGVSGTLMGEAQSKGGQAGLGVSVSHSLRAEGFDASEDGTGRGTPIVPEVATPVLSGVPNGGAGHGARSGHAKDGTLVPEGAGCLPATGATEKKHGHGWGQQELTSGYAIPVAFDLNQITSKTNRSQPDPAVHHTLPATTCPPHLASPMAVRRLTPVECERLQGFPDNFTRIPWRNKPSEQCPDGPRYKALGNSFAVNVMQWIGERIAMVRGLAI